MRGERGGSIRVTAPDTNPKYPPLPLTHISPPSSIDLLPPDAPSPPIEWGVRIEGGRLDSRLPNPNHRSPPLSPASSLNHLSPSSIALLSSIAPPLSPWAEGSEGGNGIDYIRSPNANSPPPQSPLFPLPSLSCRPSLPLSLLGPMGVRGEGGGSIRFTAP